MIEKWFEQYFTRLQYTSQPDPWGGNSQVDYIDAETFKGFRQPRVTTEIDQNGKMQTVKSWVIYCGVSEAPVTDQDRIRDEQTGEVLDVKAVQGLGVSGIGDHQEIEVLLADG